MIRLLCHMTALSPPSVSLSIWRANGFRWSFSCIYSDWGRRETADGRRTHSEATVQGIPLGWRESLSPPRSLSQPCSRARQDKHGEPILNPCAMDDGSPAECARCGKNYMASDPPVAPGGQFPIPAVSSQPLLALRCAPVIKPYLPEDASTLAGFLIDAPITFSQVQGAAPIDLPVHGASGELLVTVKVNGHTLAEGPVAVNASKAELSFSLKSLKPQTTPFDVQCSAVYATHGKPQTFTAKSTLSYLPSPPDGRSVTKMDLRTGALLAKPATGKGGAYETVFPVGFYTNFGGYLASNLSLVDEIKEQG